VLIDHLEEFTLGLIGGCDAHIGVVTFSDCVRAAHAIAPRKAHTKLWEPSVAHMGAILRQRTRSTTDLSLRSKRGALCGVAVDGDAVVQGKYQ